MPAPRTTDRVKRDAGTFRLDRATSATAAVALLEWPAAPRGLDVVEQAAWARLGDALLPLGTVGQADLLLCAYVARVMARVDAAFLDASLKTSTLSALVRLLSDLLRQLGLSPQARRNVEALPQEAAEPGADPTAEFAV
jgi:phage terminase small subunit